MEDQRASSFYVAQLREGATELDYGNYFEKPFSELTYHVRSSMGFNPNEPGHGLNHAVVCLNEPVLCTGVRIGMANNVAN